MGGTQIRIYGDPAPQGSKKGWVNKRTGRVQMTESSSRVKPWRQAVTQACLEANATPCDGPVGVIVVFLVKRPRGHFGTGKNLGTIKASSPIWVTSRACGDLDKLLRSTLDGLTDSGIIRDDSLVVSIDADKQYCNVGTQPGALITIYSLTGGGE